MLGELICTKTIMKRQVEMDPSTTAKELQKDYPDLLGHVSTRCVQKTLYRDLKYRSYRSRKKPLINEKQRKKRLAFYNQYKDWTLDQWRKVMWTDESTFAVGVKAPSRVYRKKGADPCDPKYTMNTKKNPQYVMVWGAFSYYGLGDLVILPPKTMVNQHVYINILYDHGQESMDKCQASIFQQDGAPCHTA